MSRLLPAPHERGPEHPALRAWLERMTARDAIRRARREYAAAFREFQSAPDPFFSRERMHVRDARVEGSSGWASVRGSWRSSARAGRVP